ncbi:MAG: hypothetical protein JWQ23_3326 [Herminiimonas sp.]|nr:hypothetical protein [Herminiimonas sp.]
MGWRPYQPAALDMVICDGPGLIRQASGKHRPAHLRVSCSVTTAQLSAATVPNLQPRGHCYRPRMLSRRQEELVRPTGIEPVLRASEARILSVGRRSPGFSIQHSTTLNYYIYLPHLPGCIYRPTRKTKCLILFTLSTSYNRLRRPIRYPLGYSRKSGTVTRLAGYRFSGPPSMETTDFPFQSRTITSIIKGLADYCLRINQSANFSRALGFRKRY